MEEIRKKYQLLIFSIVIIMCSAISIIYIRATFNLEAVHKDHAQQSITDIKKTFLKDTVNNTILIMEQKEKEVEEYYKYLLKATMDYFEKYYSLSPDKFLTLIIDYLETHESKDVFNVIVIDRETNKIVYYNDPSIYKENNDNMDKINIIKNNSVNYDESLYGEYYVFIGIRNDFIEKIIKDHMANEIRNAKFSNDVYIWVNEVLNYEGGDDYAIRRVHPNLVETEGQYLSTNIKDIKGSTPYLTELEGVKEKGEIFFTYYFKRKNSDEISEKLTYAKLYEKYNWIIAMGIHLDDIQIYIDKTAIANQQIIEKMIRNIILLTIILVLISLKGLSILEKWYYKHSNKKLKEEVNIDPLTKALNRRAGIRDLSLLFQNYVVGNISPAIILMDIDDFKKVNDIYGHDVGDSVLINFVKTVNNSIRVTDKLYRWGGEEFLLICEGIKEEDIGKLSNKILKNVSTINYGEKDNYITVSIGISYFDPNDTSYNDAIKRADTALYMAKLKGKNQACM